MPPASFRPHLTMDPLPLAVCLLWSYRTRDFHPLDYTHAGRTPLWCLTAPPSPRGIGRATKGKRLYGQARRLTSPDLHILCRMCTVDNKTLKSGPRIKFPCHRTQGHYGIYLPVSSGKWRSAKVSFLGAASFTWAAYVRVFVLSFL